MEGTLDSIDFTNFKPVKKKCLCYAKDGNRVIKPYKHLYSLSSVTGSESHVNLYLEIVKNDNYSWTDYHLYEDLVVICRKVTTISDSATLDDIIKSLNSYNYFGTEGVLDLLSEIERDGRYITNLHIELCELLGKTKEAERYRKYRGAYIEIMTQREKQEKNESELRAQRESEERNAAFLAEISALGLDIRNKKRVDNYRLNLEQDGVNNPTVFLYLMKKYKVSVPIKTQGWINRALSCICFEDGNITYRYNKGHQDSTVFYDYLKELECRILADKS